LPGGVGAASTEHDHAAAKISSHRYFVVSNCAVTADITAATISELSAQASLSVQNTDDWPLHPDLGRCPNLIHGTALQKWSNLQSSGLSSCYN
jgi:hypothetical protein